MFEIHRHALAEHVLMSGCRSRPGLSQMKSEDSNISLLLDPVCKYLVKSISQVNNSLIVFLQTLVGIYLQLTCTHKQDVKCFMRSNYIHLNGIKLLFQSKSFRYFNYNTMKILNKSIIYSQNCHIYIAFTKKILNK